MSDKKYIGVDLGAWSGTKTRIAVLEYNEGNLKLMTLEKEPTFSTEKPEIRNKKLKDCILGASSAANIIIAIDAPFAVPSLLGCFKGIEECYPYENPKDKKLSIQNQYLYDNSARFVYERTCQRVLAPTATLVGALTSRMVHIVDNYSDKLGICKTPHLEPVQSEKNKISTIEVFPTATLYQIIRTLSEVDQKKYLQPYTEEERKSKDVSKFTKIISYKGNHWKGKKNKEGKRLEKSQKYSMLMLIKPYLLNSIDDLKLKIQTDDDYDAIICALTAYFVDKNGYEKPDKNNLDKFTNSFIYIPKIK
jgi:predicted RNase H-like nuclease